MSPHKPLILVSNDDGVGAPGIRALADGLAGIGDVIIAAPDRERSAASHSISLDHPLRVETVGPSTYAIDGTPVDCVYLALHHLVPRQPDFVLSGINHGFNLGADVFYSGTVSAALEGALRGVPGIAFSLERSSRPDFTHAASFAAELVRELIERGPGAFDPKTLLNVNLPVGPVRGVRPTSLGHRIYRDQVAVRKDLRGREYYWIGGPEEKGADVPGSDVTAIADGLVSVTAIGLDLTHRPTLERLTRWWTEDHFHRPR